MKNYYISRLRKLSVFFAFLFASAGLMAQTNFSGTWGFNESKSNFGDTQFRFAATTLVITQEGNNLTVESTMPSRDGGERKTTDKYTLDGQVSENPGFNNSIRKSTVTWSADKTSMTIASTSTFERDGETREMKFSQTWKLAEGAKLLLVDNSFTGQNGEIKTTVAYDKK
jgi:hypothetical protein